MNLYAPLAMDNFQALDFTSSKMKPEQEKMDQPVLDLSCKKSSSISMTFKSDNLDTSSNSSNSYNSSNEEQSHTTNLSTNLSTNSDGKRSPFEGRSFMVTPPSELDSPKKAAYEPVYGEMNLPSLDHLVHRTYPSLPMKLPLPVVPTVLPPLIVQNNHSAMQIQMPKATSTTQDHSPPPISSDCNKKAPPRPFKAYPKDPLSLSAVPELMYDQNSNEAYTEFRKKMLDSVRRTSEGTNIKMRRVSKSPGLPTSTVDEKDAAYWERRRKNNEAAKRSRDARRAKEDEIAIRAAFLEQENMKLKYELVALRNETAKLRCMIYSN